MYNRALFLLLLLSIIAFLHYTLLFNKIPRHIKKVNKNVKIQHIILTKIAVNQNEISKSSLKQKKAIKKQKYVKKKRVKKIIKKQKRIIKKRVKKMLTKQKKIIKKEDKKVIKKIKHEVKKKILTKKKVKIIHKKSRDVPKQQKQKVSTYKENITTLKNNYINSIRDEIHKKLIYPSIAKRMRIEGIVYVFFTVYKNGHIGNIHVKNANKSILKKSAVKTLKNVILKAIPLELGLTKLEINLPISFKLIKG